jgi:hypothetical protein
MTVLIRKRGKLTRPSGQWQDEDYDVLADGKVIGRIRMHRPRHRRTCDGSGRSRPSRQRCPTGRMGTLRRSTRRRRSFATDWMKAETGG